ncbi:hypothetical protein BH11BAC3_BH11BAC3_08600 [soil metagenome]
MNSCISLIFEYIFLATTSFPGSGQIQSAVISYTNMLKMNVLDSVC